MFSFQKHTYLYATIITILMGHNMLLVKSLLYTVEPLVLTFVRMTLTALALLVLCFFVYGVVKPTMEQWKLLTLIGFFGVFVHQITLAIGLETSHATNGALILGLNPIATTLLGALLLKETLFRRHYIGVILSFIGICFIVFRGFSSFSFTSGDILLFFSMLAQALSFVYTRKLAGQMKIIPVTAYSYLVGAGMLLVLPFVQDMSSIFTFSAFIWLKILLASVVLTAFGFIGFNLCIQRLGAGGASIFLNVITVTALIGAVIYLGEELLIQHVFGFLFISVGIWVATHHKDPAVKTDLQNRSHSVSSS
ncbi:DMT family transporter [Alkalihalobacillus oceani]|uniref:DMT family transporter n=1 Tax=Halalkalibacter oceani TaxID=1653776 RepID=UPI00203B5E27|nr:DMT family transporter [Halalkalibacter oceani]MCM3762954.1 DMT family transporter [Halalkalibacter oceani]